MTYQVALWKQFEIILRNIHPMLQSCPLGLISKFALTSPYMLCEWVERISSVRELAGCQWNEFKVCGSGGLQLSTLHSHRSEFIIKKGQTRYKQAKLSHSTSVTDFFHKKTQLPFTVSNDVKLSCHIYCEDVTQSVVWQDLQPPCAIHIFTQRGSQ